MDPLLDDMTDVMERVLKLQKELDGYKRDIGRQRGVGTWVFEKNGTTWVLRITKRPGQQGKTSELDVSLQRANKL